MGCKGSKHALHGAYGLAARAPEPQNRSGRLAPARHSVALRSSTLGTLSLDRAAAAVAAAGLSFDAPGRGGGDEGTVKPVDGAGTKLLGPSFGGWRPTTPPPPVAAPPPPKRQKRVAASRRAGAPRTPSKTPGRDPEEINVWELMEGLDDDEDDEATDDDCVGGVERKAQSAPGSPALDPELLDAFRKALDDLTTTPADSPPLPGSAVKRNGGGGDAETRGLHEAGELASALGVCDAAPCTAAKRGAGAQDACAACGGVRFVPCDGCSGSCKVFVEDEDDASGGGAFRRCPKCNENGLVKCAVC